MKLERQVRALSALRSGGMSDDHEDAALAGQLGVERVKELAGVGGEGHGEGDVVLVTAGALGDGVNVIVLDVFVKQLEDEFFEVIGVAPDDFERDGGRKIINFRFGGHDNL